MAFRRTLSLWFPRFAAEIAMRREPELAETMLGVTQDRMGKQVLFALSPLAEEAGLRPGMGVADARAICPDLVTRDANLSRQADTLGALCRWAGQFSPWVAQDGDAALMADLTGSAHLFGGEAALAKRLAEECRDFGFCTQIGIANTKGAAWAVARFREGPAPSRRSGDAIDQEARATRSRATKRGAISHSTERIAEPFPQTLAVCIVPPDQMRRLLGPLPLAALRLDADCVANLSRLGLRVIDDLATLPRAALARRFGLEVVRRLDQVFGAEPEPLSPEGPPRHFAARLSLPDPIGLESDILAGLDRLLPVLTQRLKQAGRGARRVEFSVTRSDHTTQVLEIGLASPTSDPARIRPLLALQVARIEAGFGIDRLRLQAHVTEPLSEVQHKGYMEAVDHARSRMAPAEDNAMHALIDRIGARLGMDALTRLHPAESHIPEKSGIVMAAAFSTPAPTWPKHAIHRPPRLFNPEPLALEEGGVQPNQFRWRRRTFEAAFLAGPERIAPEWWLDDPAWRSGVRDYWRVETTDGTRLWIFQNRSENGGGWFAHGLFC